MAIILKGGKLIEDHSILKLSVAVPDEFFDDLDYLRTRIGMKDPTNIMLIISAVKTMASVVKLNEEKIKKELKETK